LFLHGFGHGGYKRDEKFNNIKKNKRNNNGDKKCAKEIYYSHD
jgi:hypothetical protein